MNAAIFSRFQCFDALAQRLQLAFNVFANCWQQNFFKPVIIMRLFGHALEFVVAELAAGYCAVEHGRQAGLLPEYCAPVIFATQSLRITFVPM